VRRFLGLLIASEIRHQKCCVVFNAQKTDRSATVLHIGPTIAVHCGHVKAIAGLDEGALIASESISGIVIGFFFVSRSALAKRG